MPLPAAITPDAFDQLHATPSLWRAVVCDIGAAHGLESSLTQAQTGTVLVALGRAAVVKLYPPFLRDHFAFERLALDAFAGKISLATPQLIATGEHHGWPYLVMTRLHGESLELAWPRYSHAQRHAIIAALGGLMREAHALPSQPLTTAAKPWPAFIDQQRRGCYARQQRTGLPAQLLDELEAFIDVALVSERQVILTGEYTPMNLLVSGAQLSAMYDFGDGFVGMPQYDWLGPMCFLAAGKRDLQQAFVNAYGGELDRQLLLRLLLLHRYSNLPVQLALPVGSAPRAWPRWPS